MTKRYCIRCGKVTWWLGARCLRCFKFYRLTDVTPFQRTLYLSIKKAGSHDY
jgi:hypothetical protein